MIYINGKKLPNPSSYRIPEFDLDSGDTTRNERGYFQRDRIRQGVAKVELQWKAITSEDLTKILDAVEPSGFSVRYITPYGYKTTRMYVGDRQVEMARGFIGHDLRWDISCNLIEY